MKETSPNCHVQWSKDSTFIDACIGVNSLLSHTVSVFIWTWKYEFIKHICTVYIHRCNGHLDCNNSQIEHGLVHLGTDYSGHAVKYQNQSSNSKQISHCSSICESWNLQRQCTPECWWGGRWYRWQNRRAPHTVTRSGRSLCPRLLRCRLPRRYQIWGCHCVRSWRPKLHHSDQNINTEIDTLHYLLEAPEYRQHTW